MENEKTSINNNSFFLSSLNAMSTSIRFISKSKVNSALPFLDVLVICDTVNYIPVFNSVKIETIANIFLRAYNICSSIFIDKEINYIYKKNFLI